MELENIIFKILMVFCVALAIYSVIYWIFITSFVLFNIAHAIIYFIIFMLAALACWLQTDMK